MLTLWLAIWQTAAPPAAPLRGAYTTGATNGGSVAASLRSGALQGAGRTGELVTAGIRSGTLGDSARGGQVIEG